ncbi:MAG: 50S ribosomal protein L19e [Nanoarchaeota archaeon]
MNLQKRLAGRILKCSPKRIRFNQESLEEIKGAITKFDVSKLIQKDIITREQKQGISRLGAKEKLEQRKKGRKKGFGSRKGTRKAREGTKRTWINKVRKQRNYLKHLKRKELVNRLDYQELYNKITGGFFRSAGHLKLYAEERGIVKPNKLG